MPESRPILTLLRRIRRRLRANRLRQEITDGAIWLLAIALLLGLWNRLAPLRWTVGWVPFGIAGAAVAAATIWRATRSAPLWEAARHADSIADLHDELSSAYWFSRHPQESEWVAVHVERARERATTLRASTLVPWVRPQRLAWPVLLVSAIGLLSVAPVPRVFETLVQQLAELDRGDEEQALGAVSALEEATDRDANALEQPRSPEEALSPQLQEQQQEGDDAIPEEAAGEESQEPDPEGQEMAADEGQQEGEPGEDSKGQQMDAENPEDMPADAEGEPSAEPNASQQAGQGESTEDTGAMLPGGDEVFLQEGGEDIEQSSTSEEELGNATREGGGEEELEEGEMTSLEVQLEREILAVPEPEDEEPPEDDDKEELVTRAEHSYLDFESVEPPAEFDKQELLESEPIPWRYRELVLTYFKTLRERDNQQREQTRQ